MRISDVSIRNAVFSWMLFAAFIIFGFISFMRLGVSQLPDVDFPVVNVSITLLGAAPEIMETSVVDPVEDALSSVQGVERISSVSKTGIANITIEFELDRNIDVALQEVQTKVAQAQRLLPPAVDPPIITKTNPDDQPILWLALVYEKNDPYFLMTYAKDYLKDRFTMVSGVGDIILGGYTDPAMRVWVDADKLRKHNIAVNDVMASITSQHTEVPGGFIQNSKNAFNVRTLGEFKDAKGFDNMIINKRAGMVIQDPFNTIRLKDVGFAKESLAEMYRISRFDGVMALGLGIKKQLGSNAVAVANAVKEQMKEIQKDLPEGMRLAINFDSSRYIEQSIHEMIKHLILAVILTSIVCWVFLGSFTATLNVLLAIPTSIMGAFIGLYFFGFTLNTFTLLGLTLAIGIVVDDAIMVLENIFRYNERGLRPIESAIVGAREITFAALAASVAIIAIFLPVAFMKGVIGKFFLQYGITISLAVMLSLLESLTITPMRCSSFVHTGERTTRIGKSFEWFMAKLKEFYGKSLNWTLAHRWPVLAVSIAFVAVSFFSVKSLNKEMTPTMDQSLFIMRLFLPIGTSLATSDQKAKEIEKWMRSQQEVAHVYASVGGLGSGGGSDANTGMMFITLKDKGNRGIAPGQTKERSQQEFMSYARSELTKNVQGVMVFMMDPSSRGFSTGKGYPIEFILQGPDWAKLEELNNKFKEDMRNSKLMVDVDSDYLAGMPEIQVTPARDKAARRGVSAEDIGITVQAMIGGVKNGQYTKDGHRYDVYVQLKKTPDPRDEFNKLLIANDRNNLIPITQVADVEQRASLQQVTRVNRQRAITMYANLAPGVSQQKALEFIFNKGNELPEGYHIDQSGAAKTFSESFNSLIFALALGVIVAYMVLASQFNSFLDPMTILMALPFSFSGAFFALNLTGQSINMYSMIGILLLMGIVKKNSILLIDFTNAVRDRAGGTNVTADAALKEACPVRLRPIIMTSVATITAALPSALAQGAGSETFKPMAITLIGGVLVSTLLTLYVVPVVYSLSDRFRKRDTRQKDVRDAFLKVGDATSINADGVPVLNNGEGPQPADQEATTVSQDYFKQDQTMPEISEDHDQNKQRKEPAMSQTNHEKPKRGFFDFLKRKYQPKAEKKPSEVLSPTPSAPSRPPRAEDIEADFDSNMPHMAEARSISEAAKDRRDREREERRMIREEKRKAKSSMLSQRPDRDRDRDRDL
ncbi:efflux RND transporter permease subunit [Bdellovibrio sp. KM01]|uniref:efflux RND transporter permease subunit n=1 Tax=Bdellovibrio sp. KM01 TaxID=2748865 RepID=UPI0015E9AE42|nr:efflux RND transporter permease subunit [Bdellovibrio sp. KM01]QLY24063.1 efflux RND transporter permease subunit [Bdellovibrio sp. KM01]